MSGPLAAAAPLPALRGPAWPYPSSAKGIPRDQLLAGFVTEMEKPPGQGGFVIVSIRAQIMGESPLLRLPVLLLFRGLALRQLTES